MTDLVNTQTQIGKSSDRRYEIDWLRSLAFILLIFYHIGMFYVADWGWHVKSAYQSTALQYLMLLVNPWRMPLIFFLSGFALCLIEPKITASKLIKIRLTRLLVPLILAMYTIIVPQAYFEAVQNYGYASGFWTFFTHYINPNTELLPQMQHGPLGLLTWNHLWYLAYLWHYTLAFLIVRPVLRRMAGWIDRAGLPAWGWFLVLVFLVWLIETLLEPVFPRTHALVDDWYNHARYFLIFITGYLVAKSGWLYLRLIKSRWIWVCAALPLYWCAKVVDFNRLLPGDVLGWSGVNTLLQIVNALCWLFAVVALCGRYLTHRNRALDYLNEAVLPWYILHQTITIALAMSLARLSLGGMLESVSVVVGTFVICAALFEVIRRSQILRFMFGMRVATQRRWLNRKNVQL